jgi:dihydropteroate synthase
LGRQPGERSQKPSQQKRQKPPKVRHAGSLAGGGQLAAYHRKARETFEDPDKVAGELFSNSIEDKQKKMNAPKRKIATWQLRSRALELGRRTLVMGIVNITPDSFSDGGLCFAPEAAVAHAMQLLGEGADLLDLGAESTRPGSRAGGATGTAMAPAVSAEEEQARLLPVLEGILRERPHAVVSVDTYKAATARAAVAAGAEIINDVSGLQWDPEMAAACSAARRGAGGNPGVVLMHTRGRPEEWRMQRSLEPDAMVAGVRAGLAASLAAAAAAGILAEAIVLDPGYGFGKRLEENYALLARQAELLALGRPLLAGVSRKSFLGRTLAPLHGGSDAPSNARETASVAALVAAILNGASIVRVHSVRPAVEAASIADAVLDGGL